MPARTLYAWAGVEFAASCLFEMVGINGGAYTYWGPHVLRVFEYPLAIGILEAAQVVCFAVAAAHLRRRARRWTGLLGLFVVFPCTFFLANLGAGAPMIITLHSPDPSTGLVLLGTLTSIAFGLALNWGAARLLPAPKAVPPQRVGGFPPGDVVPVTGLGLGSFAGNAPQERDQR
jgi:hypothetical protein